MASQCWSDGLIHSMNIAKKQLFVSDLAVVIKDIYPKAMQHFLVLPWKDIDSVYELSVHDVEILQNMLDLGVKAALSSGTPIEKFEYGYHMKPSMRRLHLHVISNDYHSPCLTSPYHWNAFNTEFFIKHEYLVEKLRETGRFDRPSMHHILKLLQSPLECNQCAHKARSFTDLKRHLQQHVESE